MTTRMVRNLSLWSMEFDNDDQKARWNRDMLESTTAHIARIKANLASIEAGFGEGDMRHFERARPVELKILRRELANQERIAAKAAAALTPVLEAAE